MESLLESPIEEIFWHEYNKHSSQEYPLIPQLEFLTRIGKLRLDFCIKFRDYYIAIECDGSDYHDKFRDEIRDAILLGDSHVGTVYRFAGSALNYSVAHCLKFILDHDLELFSQREACVIKHKAEFERNPFLYLERRSKIRSYKKRDYFEHIHTKFLQYSFTSIEEYVNYSRNKWANL